MCYVKTEFMWLFCLNRNNLVLLEEVGSKSQSVTRLCKQSLWHRIIESALCLIQVLPSLIIAGESLEICDCLKCSHCNQWCGEIAQQSLVQDCLGEEGGIKQNWFLSLSHQFHLLTLSQPHTVAKAHASMWVGPGSPVCSTEGKELCVESSRISWLPPDWQWQIVARSVF